jgi:hypothetical protein|nr:hypothetical protein [uncultured Sphingomonas sp.]
MKLKRIAMFASVIGVLALGACGGGKDEAETPTTNVGNMAPIEVDNSAATAPTEAPAAPPMDNASTASEPAPTADLSADEQTQDDADATGMTARVSRDEGGNEAQPAQ